MTRRSTARARPAGSDPAAIQRGAEAGAISLEAALAIPIVMLFFVAVVVFGHALYVRYQLARGANEIARACGMAQADAPACEEYAKWHLTDLTKWCPPEVSVDVDIAPLSDLEGVSVVAVGLRCAYAGGVAQAVLGRAGVSFGSLEAQALVPY